jgi:hypothetical protein
VVSRTNRPQSASGKRIRTTSTAVHNSGIRADSRVKFDPITESDAVAAPTNAGEDTRPWSKVGNARSCTRVAPRVAASVPDAGQRSPRALLRQSGARDTADARCRQSTNRRASIGERSTEWVESGGVVAGVSLDGYEPSRAETIALHAALAGGRVTPRQGQPSKSRLPLLDPAHGIDVGSIARYARPP